MLQFQVPHSFDLADLKISTVKGPQPPQPGQVLVRMSAVSLNYRDIMVATGHDRWRPPVGRVPCSDGVGTVEQIGEGVTRFTVGDVVMTTILPNWIAGPLTDKKRQAGLGGPAADGVLSEYVVLAAEGLVKAPRYLTPVEASTLPTAGVTAWHALTRAGALRSDAVILTGGTGGVSLFVLQLGLAAGATVLVTSSSEAKLEKLRSWGAAGTINYAINPHWADNVLMLTDGRGVDLAVDIGGASSLNESIRATAMGGAVSVVGLIGGLDATINLAEIFRKNLRLDGVETGSRSMLEEMIAWIAQMSVHPIIDRVFPFDKSADAFQYLRTGQHIGKVCITF